MIGVLNALAGLILTLNGQTYSGGGQTVDYLVIRASDVTVTDLRVRESGPGVNGVSVYGDRNVLRRLIVERHGASGVYFYSGTGHVLEDSVIRDPVRQRGVSSWAIFSGTTGSITVRRNLVYGSGFSNYAPGGSAIVEDNNFIIPDDYRTDCAGRIERDGPCQCAQFGVALRSGNAIVRHNTISGYRRADPFCGGGFTPGAGIVVAACGVNESCATNNVLIEGNVIRQSRDGIYVSPRSTNVVIAANRVCDTAYAISDGFGNPSTIVNNEFSADNSVNLHLYGSRRGAVSGNSEIWGTNPCAGSYP